MIKLSDYVIKRLVEHKIKHIFLISGGGAMHLNDSVGKNKNITYICNHHEQASAISAEGYARVSGELAVVNVTTGPGGTNTITGVISQWLDSIPVLYISGQVKLETCVKNYPEIGLRQLGDQEINIIDIVKPITKYAKMITNPLEIKKEIDKAIFLATSGRPGPVWLDIPLDIQGSFIDETKLKEYTPKPEFIHQDISKIDQIIDILKKSKRPIIIAGHGIRIAGAINQFKKLIESLNIPTIMTFNGIDILPTDHPLNIGRMGTVGDRAGNFAIQNSDVYISIGSRNNIRQISYNWKTVATSAIKIVIDIDPAELKKPTFKPDISLHLNAKDFIQEFQNKINSHTLPKFDEWVNWCQNRKKKYPTILPDYQKTKNGVHPYYFTNILTKNLPEKAICVGSNGTACVTLFQAGHIKNNQRIFWNSGCATMGYALPAAIGACFANHQKEVICLTGDGSIMMNIQELTTIAYYKLPIKIFILNNDGYISIRQTQENFFQKRFTACDSSCGVGFPNFIKLAQGFEIPTLRIDTSINLNKKIQEILQKQGPFICEVKLPKNYKFSPKLSSEKLPNGKIISKPLEDMYPFLDREEFQQNIIKNIKKANI